MAYKTLLFLLLHIALTPLLADEVSLDPKIVWALEKYCYKCHDSDVQKGEVRLDNFDSLSHKHRLDLLSKIQEQLYTRQMPPKKQKKQLTSAQHRGVLAWISGTLKTYNASTLEDKLRYPDYGNYVDHEMLFSGNVKEAPYSPARRWLVSPQIFHERVMAIFKVEGNERETFKNRNFYGITNPFVLQDSSGVRDYDNHTLNGGHLLNMLSNAEWISRKQIFAAQNNGIDRRKIQFKNPRDKWYPKAEEVFVKIVSNKSSPSTNKITEAIQTQFDNVLGRRASEMEVKEYLTFTRAAMAVGGNAEGLRQMLKAVVLESDFLYRLEFGAGPTDRHDRRKLSPHEAAYAISYALGDRGPDSKLLAAAKKDKLRTKADYKREVARLLADKSYYKGFVDPNVGGKNLRPYESSHPKIVRFFREFFGYDYMSKVFKDAGRSGGFYANPGRGTLGTPGYVVNEADKLVDHILKEDKDVFARLLTTDEYYVYDYDYQRGTAIVAKWKAFYEKYKNTDFIKNQEKIVKENRGLVALTTARGNHTNRIDRFMQHMSETFGKNRTPFPVLPWAHGNRKVYAPIYNLPKLPRKPYNESDYWSYPLQQPFKIANRKGILTHPAWLVAHSHNAETDPVKRGRWIREKLLAGRVPDIPITVDAQVPEDPHKTLRERFDAVTQQPDCWRCHKYMNPLGYPFEVFDDFGRYRTEENLEHPENIITESKNKSVANTYKTKAVNSEGFLDSTGSRTLDGKVDNAFDMIERLAQSTRVRQSIIRHAFRFYMGRNEMLSDSQTLIDADKAYVQSGGSFKAVILSLLSSDSFIYRKTIKNGGTTHYGK